MRFYVSAREVAAKFQPEKIVLFGSYAYGTPHDDSDVDILVVMPAHSQLRMAARIENVIAPPFPVDIIVRTPQELKWRLEERESFLTEVTTKGKLLYEKKDKGVGKKSRVRLSGRAKTQSRKDPLRDQSCFFCQQSAEKYMKALLAELGLTIPRTHNLQDRLMLLQPHRMGLGRLRRGMTLPTRFAVGTRYPGDSASKRDTEAALRWVHKVRLAARTQLGLPVES